ncbi:uncharacterized protein LOC121858833 [Homarus americanus]|uniref:Glucosidase 2 subunit beta-like 2 n=1 Tax=Homarus americanus TaxID=6706 RepID=A0A8J5N884_HOMAM|nr:uncharacterized protein LOC121858833 [Homarus americanus]KAG7174837.1 Glucosidase 2 subunit beta-like 2 [Homarus americanus]
MSLGRLLRSMPMRRHTVIGALVMATVLFIVYQFTFVAELSESSKPKQHQPNIPKRHIEIEDSNRQKVVDKDRSHPKDIHLVNGDGKKDKTLHEEEVKAVHKVDKVEVDVVKQDKGSKDISKSDVRVTSQDKEKATFKCVTTGKVIPLEKLNDDFCDCPEDGSDEPRTNACVNGKFSCLKHLKNFPKVIPSSWVNDGVCDCCDGSDEWKKKKVDIALSIQLQNKVGRYLSPCPNRCPL